MKICPRCGYNNPITLSACMQCGQTLDSPQEPDSDSPVPSSQSPDFAGPNLRYVPSPGVQPLTPAGPASRPPNDPFLTTRQKTRQFFTGLGAGLLPLLLTLVGLDGFLKHSSETGFALYAHAVAFYGGILLFVAAIVLMIVLFFFPRRRFIAYGLLTMILASPVIFFIGCLVLIAGH